MQHVDKPTRQRGDDEPSILDLVISREYLSKLEYLSPLGKSDHAIIKLECEVMADICISKTEIVISQPPIEISR